MTPQLEAVIEMAMNLSSSDRVQLIEHLKSTLDVEQPINENDNFMLMLANSAKEQGFTADSDDLSENFDEELRKSWVEHLERKWASNNRPD